MTRLDAIKELMSEARTGRNSTASAKRAVRACKTLGLAADEIVQVMRWLEYCNADGVPFNANVERVW